MPNGGSGHYFRMTGRRYVYRNYCACCKNYRALKRYPTKVYYCSPCTTYITKEIRKRHMEFGQIALHPEWNAIIEEIAGTRQAELSQEKKTTEKDFTVQWRPARKQHTWRRRK